MGCIFCNLTCENEIELSDGNIIHNSCYKNNLDRLDRLQKDLKIEENNLRTSRRQYSEENSIISGIFRTLTGTQKRYTRDPTPDIERKIIIINRDINNIKRRLDYIHDYMLQYPPDWENRRKKLKEIRNYKCVKCGNNYRLQIHHIIPLSKGGSNKIENLEFVCRNCHLKLHRQEDKDFEEIYKDKLSIQKKIELINVAINNNQLIEFLYKKPTDQVYIKRLIKPKKFDKIYHIEKPDNFTLCVEGFCYLRQENRTFALKRIKNLKIKVSN